MELLRARMSLEQNYLPVCVYLSTVCEGDELLRARMSLEQNYLPVCVYLSTVCEGDGDAAGQDEPGAELPACLCISIYCL